jgi:hypothetical protein
MSERAHVIDIERLVLDGVDHLRPMEVRALIEREVGRALRRTELSTNEASVANAVAHSVEQAWTRSNCKYENAK